LITVEDEERATELRPGEEVLDIGMGLKILGEDLVEGDFRMLFELLLERVDLEDRNASGTKFND